MSSKKNMNFIDRRKSHGSTKPNVFFLFQVVIVLLFSSIILKLNLGAVVDYVVFVASIAFIIYFLVRRRAMILRQTE